MGISGGVTRREFHRLALGAGAMLAAPGNRTAAAPRPLAFAHPGILYCTADLERMRKAVKTARPPIAQGFEKLRVDPYSQLTYQPHAFAAEIGRNPPVNFSPFDSDANAAYQCALIAAITGDRRYASRARTIVLGWSRSLQRVSGRDAVLMAALGPFKLINAAEMLRAMGDLDGASASESAAMLRRAILPPITDFAPFANGNWDTAAIKTMLAIAVFCDDRALFERALTYALHGDGDGRLTHCIYENGQCQESGRDQQHTQLGLAHLGDACEIAWHQGIDLYGAAENRLLRGFEYTAAYNIGDAVEFKPDVDRTGKYRHQLISPRGPLRPVYEQILAHYHVRRRLPAPAVERAVAKLRPEGAANGADHTGFGTLLYVRDAADAEGGAARAAPAAVYADAREGAIELSWLPSRGPDTFDVERADVGGAMRIVARASRRELDPAVFRDIAVTTEQQYSYRVAAHCARRGELVSSAVAIMAGLPREWTLVALGKSSIALGAQFDGQMLTLRAAGSGLMAPEDEGLFVAVPQDCTALTARFVPQTASQFVQFGLSWRSGNAAGAAAIALVVRPESGDRESSGWHIGMMTRNDHGDVSAIAAFPLAAPELSYGRLVGPLWFRLRRDASVVRSAISTDGAAWKKIGEAPSGAAGRMGLIASSGIVFGNNGGKDGVDACVRFDSIEMKRRTPT